MGMIAAVVEAIDDITIKRHVDQNIDVGYVYSSDWEVEMAQANVYLQNLLQDKLSQKPGKLTREEAQRARRALSPYPEGEVDAWIAGLKRDYFPALLKVW